MVEQKKNRDAEREKVTRIGLNDGITVNEETRTVHICDGVDVDFDTILHLAYGILESTERLKPASTTYEFFQSIRDAGIAREKDGTITITFPYAGGTPT